MDNDDYLEAMSVADMQLSDAQGEIAAKDALIEELVAVGIEWANARKETETFNKETWDRLANAESNLAVAIAKAKAAQ